MSIEMDRRALGIAAGQHGVITRRQLLAVGVTDRVIENRVQSGWWSRIAPGVYLLPGFVDSLHSLLAAVTTALPATVSHESAAERHGLPDVARGRAVVSVPDRSTHYFPDVVVHQSTDIGGQWIVEIEALPVTRIDRTLFDLAAVLRPRRLTRVIEGSMAARLVTYDELIEVVGLLGRRGKRGVQELRRILEGLGPGPVRTDSELERLFLDVIDSGDLPRPETQYPLPWRDHKTGRVDFAYPRARLIIECDGRRFHTLSEAFEADRRRDNLATLAGWRVLRFTWKQLVDRPDEVCRMIRDALAMSLLPQV